MNFQYIIPRTIRHFLPSGVTRFLLQHGWLIRPGQETFSPQAALDRYQKVSRAHDISWKGKSVMVFGYGGSFAFGCSLLESGARHVILCDKYAPPNDARNRPLLPRYGQYLTLRGNHVLPRPEAITLLEADIREIAAQRQIVPVDLIFSSDVFEHLDDVNGITRALAELTQDQGSQVHFIDLRDHYFKYPFEMLCYPESIWRGWLNPGSNHNRYRLTDYRRVFDLYFEKVSVEVVARDEAAFQATYARIRPEFLTGDREIDSVTLIQVITCRPRRPALE
jgi:hypothetical protein